MSEDPWPEGLRSPATHTDLADALGVGPRTVLAWVHTDGLPAFRTGRQIRITRAGWTKWASRRAVTGAR